MTKLVETIPGSFAEPCEVANCYQGPSYVIEWTENDCWRELFACYDHVGLLRTRLISRLRRGLSGLPESANGAGRIERWVPTHPSPCGHIGPCEGCPELSRLAIGYLPSRLMP